MALNINEKQDNDILIRSWPIVVTVIPMIMNLYTGNADLWNDFILLLFILYFVYQCLTVPWSYYESARYRYRPIRSYSQKYFLIKRELRQHEFAGLVLVCISPIIGGYLLQCSRYVLSSADKYVSTFNVTVFIIGASIKPITHAITLLTQGTLFLESERHAESKIHLLQNRIERLQQELKLLQLAYVTKQDLNEATDEISPALIELSTTLHDFDQREVAWLNEKEGQFNKMYEKVQTFDQFMFYKLQRQKEASFVIQLLQFPIQFSIWLSEQT